MLFDSIEFDGEDGLVFRWDPLFWGFGPEEFRYSRLSLQKAIIDELERENWLGACCEPNSIFVVLQSVPCKLPESPTTACSYHSSLLPCGIMTHMTEPRPSTR